MECVSQELNQTSQTTKLNFLKKLLGSQTIPPCYVYLR